MRLRRANTKNPLWLQKAMQGRRDSNPQPSDLESAVLPIRTTALQNSIQSFTETTSKPKNPNLPRENREPTTRLELVTSSLPRKCSTTELCRHAPLTSLNGLERAGDEVRTRDIQLGRLTLYQLSYSRVRFQ